MQEERVILSNNIKSLRTAYGLSQPRFAARCGISQSEVSVLENLEKHPEHNPTLRTLERVCSACKISLWQLWLPGLCQDKKMADRITTLIDAYVLASEKTKDYISHIAENSRNYG